MSCRAHGGHVVGRHHGVQHGFLDRFDRGQVDIIERLVIERIQREDGPVRPASWAQRLATEKARKISPELLPPGEPPRPTPMAARRATRLQLVRLDRRVGAKNDDDRALLGMDEQPVLHHVPADRHAERRKPRPHTVIGLNESAHGESVRRPPRTPATRSRCRP